MSRLLALHDSFRYDTGNIISSHGRFEFAKSKEGRCHHLPKDSNNSSETTSAVHPQVSGRTTMTAVLSARMLKAP